MATDELFSRDEVLGGLPARRARTLLFLVESRTGHLVARSHQMIERYVSEEEARERELTFVEAFSQGRDPPVRPTIQDLEHHAPEWAPLVPTNPQVRAALARLLGEKYRFARRRVPHLRAALGLDEAAVQRAYERLYGEPIERVFAQEVNLAERLRWAWSRLDGWLQALPPSWVVFAFTLTETVGTTILALPIAAAEIGPLGGVALLIVIGIANVLTIAAMAEAVARNGTFRFGHMFLGGLVAEYLGGLGATILTVMVTIIYLVALLAFYIGLSTTLAAATGVPAELWAGLLFLVGLYYVSRGSLNATVASALVVGAVNIVLILVLSALAATSFDATRLGSLAVPGPDGRPLDPGILGLIFGVIFACYFGHTSLAACGQLVLRRDPSARSLIWGAAAAQLAAIVLYVIWEIVIGGAIPAEELAGLSGTVLPSLADRAGPVVYLIGSVFVILGMGMTSIHFSLGLYFLVRERLPRRSRHAVALPRRRGRLVFRTGPEPTAPRLGLTYLALRGGQPQIRVDAWSGSAMRQVETTVGERWETLGGYLDSSEHSLQLAVRTVEAERERVLLQVDSSVTPTYEGAWDASGLELSGALELADDERRVVTWLMRRRTASPAELAAAFGGDEPSARAHLESLASRGFVRAIQENGGPRYRVQLGRRRGAQLPSSAVWEGLSDRATDEPAMTHGRPLHGLARRVGDLVLGERGRFLISISPVVAIFLLVEWLIVTRSESFAKPLGLAGVIVCSIVGGVFPVLLVTSAVRKSDHVLRLPFRLYDQPVVKAVIGALFLVAVFLHGLVIWEGSIERAAALLTGGLMVVAMLVMARRGAFTRRAVVELRSLSGAADVGRFSIVVAGELARGDVALDYPSGQRRVQAAAGDVPDLSSLRSATFDLPKTGASELKVWAHRVTPDGESSGLPANVEVNAGPGTRRIDLEAAGGQVVLPIDEPARVRVSLGSS